MADINDIPDGGPGDVTDTVEVIIFDLSAPLNTEGKRVSRAELLKDVARQDGDHNFGTSEIADLTVATSLSVTGDFVLPGGSAVTNLVSGSLALTFADIAAGAGETVTATLTGVATTDFLSFAFTAILPDGLIAQAWISNPSEVSVRLFNAGSSLVLGATYTMRASALRIT